MTRPDPCHPLATCGAIIQMQAAHAASTTSTAQLYRRCLLTASRLRVQSYTPAERFPHQFSYSGGTPSMRRLMWVAESRGELARFILAVCPDLGEDRISLPQVWSDKAPSADVILVMEIDLERTKKLIEPNQALTL